jgi:hypothetical protein
VEPFLHYTRKNNLPKGKKIGSPRLAYFLYLILQHRYLSYKQLGKLDSLRVYHKPYHELNEEDKKKTDVRISQTLGNAPSKILMENKIIEKVSIGGDTILWAGASSKDLVSQYQKQLENEYLGVPLDLSYFTIPGGILDSSKRGDKAKKDNSAHELAIRDFLVSLKEKGIDYWLCFERIPLEGDAEIRPDAAALLKKDGRGLFIYIEIDCGTEDMEKIQDKFKRYQRFLKINDKCLVYDRVKQDYCPQFGVKTPLLEDLGVRVYYVHTGSPGKLKRAIREGGNFRIVRLGDGILE